MLMESEFIGYETPQVEIIELEIEQAVLNASGMEPKDGYWN